MYQRLLALVWAVPKDVPQELPPVRLAVLLVTPRQVLQLYFPKLDDLSRKNF
jgi:hypothetical protein